MREIKFRVWDKKKNRWFHGSTDPARIATSTDAISLFGEVITFGELMVDQNNEEAVSLDRLNDLVALQYTGLKDKNGREIYEGDIVRVTDVWGGNTKHQIKYLSDSNYPAFDLVPWLEVETNGLTYCMGSDAEIEVIGNIYENPELLEAES